MAGGHCLAKFALLWINPITGVRPESVADFFGSAARQSKTLELRTDSIGPIMLQRNDNGVSAVQSVRRLLSICLLVFGILAATAVNAFALPQLLIDMRTNEVLYENEAGIPWHPASLTKLMTALIAFEAIETGQATLSTPVITSANALSVEPSRLGLPEGTAITLEDALYMLVVKSANDIAVAIGETIAGSEPAFVEMMNARAAIMGLSGTHFVNPHGLHDPAQVTTARDIAMIALTIKARFPQYDALFPPAPWRSAIRGPIPTTSF